MADINNQADKTKRDALNERMLSRYPDLDVNDSEAMSSRISDDYDEFDRQIGEYKEREGKLTDMMNKDPRSAYLLSSWANGENPAIAMMRMFGPEFKEALDDPELRDKLDEAQKEYLERVAKSKELEENYATNMEQSYATRDQFQDENGLSDDEMNQIWDTLQQEFEDMLVGKFSRDSMERTLKAIRHDEDVEVAAQDAEVRGRNAKIDEKLRKRNAGDGTAALMGKNNAGTRPAGPDLGALNRFEGNDDIFTRGGEKRITRR